jgi:hypothetical protein
MSLPTQPELQSSKNLRQFLSEKFKEIILRGDNVITLTSNLSGIFDRVTSPNEFTGPLVEAWAHIHLAKILENYNSAAAREQEFADARAEYQGQSVLLNIKAKDREMNARSRINLSSFQRYKTHYSQPNPPAFYVMLFEYEWRPQGNQLWIIIEKLKYAFNLLEIPVGHYKIEGAFEGSHRIFISPIPESAKTESTTYSIITPSQFLQRLEELREAYVARKGSRARK